MHPRAPVLFVSHGAPTIALDPGAFGADLAAFAARTGTPRAIVVVSAHWTGGRELGVTSAAQNRIVHDFAGFPEALYRIRWPAPGAPDVAARVAAILDGAGFRARLDPVRGLDHGAWVPLRIAWPEATVPVVQVALPEAPPPRLLEFGAALAPLRDEGVLLVASGGVVHNLWHVRLGDPDAAPDAWAVDFDRWLDEKLRARDVAGLVRWREDAPHAAVAAPTSEHLDPLFVALGAALPGDRLETVHAGIVHGNLGMRSFALLPPAAASADTAPRKEQPA
jgi:4,5-DOPA dioxygenase extradiol